MSELSAQLRHTPIAVIGLGAIMPEAHNLREFWDNIIGKVDCITDTPASRWDISKYYDPDPTAPDKTYSKRGGFLPEVDFDPLEFGLPPNILEVTDVSQMLSLLVAKEALSDAGYLMGAEEIRDRTGVILGVGGGQKLITPLTSRLQYPVWDEVLKSYGIGDEDRAKIIERMKLAYIRWEENSFPGMLGNVISGRIANRFDLGGTNCVVDAACASTMAALKMAVAELTDRRADMMITGGVDVDNSIFMFMCFSKTPAFTKGSHSRPFDAESDGMLVGEGIGMLVLKRLEDAERDGDRVYAVIKGIGSSSDGRFKSIYAPRGEGQEKALRRAYEDAAISPATVGLVEAHGTGTVAGDSTEVTTVIRYFNQHDTQKQHIAIGSVKSQIGHTKASAGAAGLIKTTLALHHKVLPPTRNVTKPNPKFDMANSSFYVSTEARPWIRAAEDTPRRAGVSSFGFGGTNFHVVLEEYTGEHKGAYRVHHVPQGVILNAGSAADLRAAIVQHSALLQGDDAESAFLNLVRDSRSASIPAGAARVGFVAANAEEARSLLSIAADMLASKPDATDWAHPKGIYYRRTAQNTAGHVVALFAGQGSQYLDMGRELALNFPEVRESFGRIDSLLEHEGKRALSDVVYPRPAFEADEKAAQEAALQGTDYAQPAIGALSAGMFKLLSKAGFKADFAAGHSFGEVSALWASGVVSDEDYYALVKARGAAMAPPANDPNFDAGTMLAVTGDVAAIEREVAALAGVQVANQNSRTQVVIAGSKQAVAQAESALKAKGFKTVALTVSAAFHTPLVGHAQKPFAQAINAASFNAPKSAVYSNATGTAYPTDPAAIRAILSEHILQPVKFRDQIENIYNAGGTIFVEFGPRNVLTNLVKDILGDKPHVAIALNGSRQKDSDRQMRDAAVQLQVLGLPLSAFDPYAIEPEIKPKSKKGLVVKLSGNNYVSDKTRATYAAALASGGSVALPLSVSGAEIVPAPSNLAPIERGGTNGTNASDETLTSEPQSAALTSDQSAEQVDMYAVLSTLEATLAHFREHQRETQRVHEQFTQTQGEYFKIFFELTQQQATMSASLPAGAADAISQSMLRFHEYQSETLRLHEQYMRTQTDVAQSLLEIVRAQYGAMGTAAGLAVHAAPAAVRSTPALPVKTEPLRASAPVVAVETPKPAVSAPAVEMPVLAPVQPAAPVVQKAAEPVAAPVKAEPVAAVAAPAPSSNSAELAALSAAMLRIVGDKTGYPTEMLELGMDMEADLGIDSIKRVEILGAMREEFPKLPQFSPEELGELRTLQQIVDYMNVRSGGGTAVPAAIQNGAQAAANGTASHANGIEVQPVTTPAVLEATPEAPKANAANGAQIKALSDAMLRIVGDKTGYPTEMLELSMDMEADLGIDSIKRVEILGAMREEFPSLPQFSPEELGELRTLQQIVDYMEEAGRRQTAPFELSGDAAAVAPSQAEGAEEAFDTRGILRAEVELKRLPAPDSLDYAVHGAVCIVTDDGTATTRQVAQVLTAGGWNAVVLRLPSATNAPEDGSQSVQLADWSEAGIQAALTTIETTHGSIGGYVQMTPAGAEEMFNQADKTLVKFGFLMAKHLKARLMQGNGTGRKCFVSVTRMDGALGTTSTTGGTITGGLFGLIKTLSLEWEGVFCRAIDIAPDTGAEQVANLVAAELRDPNRLVTEVAYGARGRVTLVTRKPFTNGDC